MKITIIGRPNVGKSTLFNKIIRERYAIESEVSGTTRDKVSKEIVYNGQKLTFVDTGGILKFNPNEEELKQEIGILEQVKVALDEGQLIVLVVDGQVPPTKEDIVIAKEIRKSGKEIILCINKIDNKEMMNELFHYKKLGIENTVFTSAVHKEGIDILLSKIYEKVKESKIKGTLVEEKEVEKVANMIKVGFFGRPNVGKSSLLNSIFNQKRNIVSDIAGTTRDATEHLFEYEDYNFNFIDTAGIRRRGKVKKGIEKYSVMRSLDSVEKCDVACLLLDATQVTAQDQHITEFMLKSLKPMIIVVNKWDLVEEKAEDMMTKFLRFLQVKFDYLYWSPVIFVSAKNRKRVHKIFDVVIDVYKNALYMAPKLELNELIQVVVAKNLPPRIKHRNITIFGGRQVSVQPSKIEIYTNRPDEIHYSYKRYLENRIREKFGFEGVPLQIDFMKKG